MPLSYLRDDCHKQAITHIRESRRFESMYTLQGKTRPTHHTLPTLSPRMFQYHMYLMWSTYSNPSRDADRFGQIPLLPRKGASDTIHSTPADRSVGPYLVSLLSQPMKQGHKPSSCQWPPTRLTGPISPTCDRYIQYLLAGANPSVLNRHRRWLQPWRCQLTTYYSPTFPTSCLHFPPKSPGRCLV
jgi:hypothetical protein